MMSDTTVTVCDGILYDSGGPGQTYSSNENFTFSIVTDGTITLNFFEEFCVENGFDFLYIYDGPDTSSPLIITLTGTNIGIPPSITSSGGAITLQFTSESNTNYCGWIIEWDTTVPPPIPPSIAVNTLPVCGNNVVQIDFSYPIGCDWLSPTDFTFYGDDLFSVSSINVICVNDSSTTTELILGEPIDYNCQYTVDLILGIPDVCDSIWLYELSTTFIYDSCPIQAEIIADADTVCSGTCLNIIAIVEGCFDHTYLWDNSLPPTPGPHEVCPDETTTYTVEITEVPTGNMTTVSFTIGVLPAQILQNDTTICQSLPGFFLTSDPPIGEWYGPGIQDVESGFFEPDSANAGPNTIYFVASAQCVDSVIITITPIDAGLTTAACPGSPPFIINGTPPGGIWSGPFIDPDGTFDPSTSGSYLVYYDVNGCQDSVQVNVDDIAGEFDIGDICQSVWLDTLEFSPIGGAWSGPGLLDTLLGIFVPEDIDPGSQSFLYDINGCDQLFNVNILEIYTGGRSKNSCPAQDPFIPYENFTPTGGTWVGNGIVDDVTGLYDPGIVPNDSWNALIYYAPNGCSDTIWMYNRETEILTDTVYFCDGDDVLPLEWETVGRTPWGGDWFGNGILNPWNDNYFEFSPTVAGVGQHWLIYDNNDCQDSMLAIVFPNQLTISSVTICQSESAFLLDPGIPEGGLWVGNGIADEITGLFDPAMANPGDFYVYWGTVAGCLDSIAISLEEYFESSISGLNSQYCFQNTDIPVQIEPPDAMVTGPVLDGFFNPALAGEGDHTISVEYSGALCSSSQSILVSVYPELTADLSASDNLICPGTGTTLSVTSNGGFPDALLQYQWSNSLFPIDQNNVAPEVTTTYFVLVNDGCSDPALDSVVVEVLPPISNTVTTSDTLCFGSAGWAHAQVDQLGEYLISWGTNPIQFTDSVIAPAGSSHYLQITNVEQGCTYDTLVLIPNYSPLAALFSLNPNAECIAFDDNPISFIDLSQHGLYGTWDFGNGSIEPYDPGSNPSVNYDQPGTYPASLVIYNEGDCPDSAFVDVCILPPTPIFIPDVFSPNGDGNNDVLYVRGQGIIEMYFMLYDRWGEKVFETSDNSIGWNGEYRGKPMPSGVYVYYLSVTLNSGYREEIKGDITLVR
jgi:gliding motility-associated-like protein